MQVKQTFFWVSFFSFLIVAGQMNGSDIPGLIQISHEECEHNNFINDSARLMERHSLFELIMEEENLVAKHPWMVMSAPQRVLSLCLYMEPQRIWDFEYREGKVNYYPVFRDGIPMANGLNINGHLRAIETFVDYVRAAAQGDGSASKMLLFVGPSGTGKTRFLNVLTALSENLTKSEPDYFSYRYEWKNLGQIPTLVPFINETKIADGTYYEHPRPCPIKESPLNLLPQEYLEYVIDKARAKVEKMIDMPPKPKRYMCPQCSFFKEEILKFYMQQNGLDQLNPEQEVRALESHIDIVRHVVGQNGSMAKIDAEAKDVDFASLLMSQNPFISSEFGPSHPMSYYLDGKILQGNGLMVLFDEFMRNHPGLRDAVLNLIEDHRVAKGGAPAVELDIMVFGATNYESLENAEQNDTAKAHIDRTLRIKMGYLLNPFDEALNLLMMKGMHNILMQDLYSKQRVPVSAIAEELFPVPMDREERLGPDYRYKLWYAGGSRTDPIHISPHVLMYISLVTTGSRLVVNPEHAKQFGARHVINDLAYQDIYTRLKILMGRHRVNASAHMDLRSLSREQREGDAGISERDAANVWLTKSLIKAQEQGRCLIIDIAYQMFRRLLEDGTIKFPDNKTRRIWLAISEDMIYDFVVPTLEADVNTGLGSGLGVVESIYDEVFQEITALSLDDSAKSYISDEGETRFINFERLKDIKERFRNTQHRELAIAEVVISLAVAPNQKIRPHPGLYDAVRSYLAARETDRITYEDLVRYANTREGNAELREQHNSVSHVMEEELGYCKTCLTAALMTVRESKSRISQVE